MLNVYTWGYFRPAYIRHSDVSVPAGSWRHTYSLGVIRRWVRFVSSSYERSALSFSNKDWGVRLYPRSRQAYTEASRGGRNVVLRQKQSCHHRCFQLFLFWKHIGGEYSKKFMIPTFDCYFSLSDLIQHLHQYQDKMVIYARNDPILCRIFPSSLKGVASDWFYSLPLWSIHNFKDLIKLFLSQYSCQEFK